MANPRHPPIKVTPPPGFENGENVTVAKSELAFTRFPFQNVPVIVPFQILPAKRYHFRENGRPTYPSHLSTFSKRTGIIGAQS